jgi:hypothetical protein
VYQPRFSDGLVLRLLRVTVASHSDDAYDCERVSHTFHFLFPEVPDLRKF